MHPQIESSTTETTTDGLPAGLHDVTSAAATRRQFPEFAAAGIAAATIGQEAWGGQPKHNIPYRTLGRTGEKVSVVGIGGYHLGRPGVTEDESLHIVRKALDNGSTSWTTVGTTTVETARSAWDRPCGTATAKRRF